MHVPLIFVTFPTLLLQWNNESPKWDVLSWSPCMVSLIVQEGQPNPELPGLHGHHGSQMATTTSSDILFVPFLRSKGTGHAMDLPTSALVALLA